MDAREIAGGARRLAETLPARSAEIERSRRLPPDVVETLARGDGAILTGGPIRRDNVQD